MGVIYKITNPNGRTYVGRSKYLPRRINTYKYRAADPKETKSIIVNSIRKYRWENHKLEILEECENNLLSEREKFWILELKTYFFEYPNGMNMSLGGEEGGRTWMFDVERRKKQSEKFSGSGGTFYGKTHTKEWREKKSKEVSVYNKKMGITIPKWGAEKGRLRVIKPVLMYDKNGYFIKEFCSYTDAGNYIGIQASHVWESISGRKSQAKGFHFREKVENFPLKIDVSNTKQQTIKRPVYWLSEDLDVICEFPSGKEASDFFDIPKTTINRAAQYNDLNPIRTGHIFCYKDEYLNEYKLVS